MPPRAKLDFEFQPLKLRLASQRLEAEAQRIGIDGRQFADAQAHFHRLAMTLRRFRLHRFEYGLCDTKFVHTSFQPSAIRKTKTENKTFPTEDTELHRGTPQRSSS